MGLRVIAALILASLPSWATGGTFCWDPVSGALWYHLYSTEVGQVLFVPAEGDPVCTLEEPAWSACSRESFSAANCAANRCCAYVVDPDGWLVLYFMSADTDLEGGGRESLTRPMEPCP